MPRHICVACLNQLTIAYTFKKKCEQSDHVLKSFIAYCKTQREEASQKAAQQNYLASFQSQIQNSKIKIEAEVIIDSSSNSEYEAGDDEHEIGVVDNNGISLISSDSSSDDESDFDDDGFDYDIVKDRTGKYSCQTCFKAFIRIRKLKNHIKIHHADVSELAQCSTCFKR